MVSLGVRELLLGQRQPPLGVPYLSWLVGQGRYDGSSCRPGSQGRDGWPALRALRRKHIPLAKDSGRAKAPSYPALQADGVRRVLYFVVPHDEPVFVVGLE